MRIKKVGGFGVTLIRMIHRFRRHLPRVARLLLGMLGSVWLTAMTVPCVMAAPCELHQHQHSAPCHDAGNTSPRDANAACPAAGGVDCQLITTGNPAPPALDQATPALALLALPPAIPMFDRQAGASPDTDPFPPPAGPPLYLRHLTLLI
jgi:hypothetical protein